VAVGVGIGTVWRGVYRGQQIDDPKGGSLFGARCEVRNASCRGGHGNTVDGCGSGGSGGGHQRLTETKK